MRQIYEGNRSVSPIIAMMPTRPLSSRGAQRPRDLTIVHPLACANGTPSMLQRCGAQADPNCNCGVSASPKVAIPVCAARDDTILAPAKFRCCTFSAALLRLHVRRFLDTNFGTRGSFRKFRETLMRLKNTHTPQLYST